MHETHTQTTNTHSVRAWDILIEEMTAFKMELALFINSHYGFNTSNSTYREANNLHSPHSYTQAHIPWKMLQVMTFTI